MGREHHELISEIERDIARTSRQTSLWVYQRNGLWKNLADHPIAEPIIVPAESEESEEAEEDPAESPSRNLDEGPSAKRRAVGEAPQGTSATSASSDAASMPPPRFVPRQRTSADVESEADVESPPLAPQPKALFPSVLRRRGARPKSL